MASTLNWAESLSYLVKPKRYISDPPIVSLTSSHLPTTVHSTGPSILQATQDTHRSRHFLLKAEVHPDNLPKCFLRSLLEMILLFPRFPPSTVFHSVFQPAPCLLSPLHYKLLKGSDGVQFSVPFPRHASRCQPGTRVTLW